MSLLSFYDKTLVSLGQTDILDTSNPLTSRKLKAVAKRHAVNLQVALDNRPFIRESKTDQLDRIDWSVRESDLPKTIFEDVVYNSREVYPPGFHAFNRGRGVHGTYYPFRTAAHGCVLTANWSDEMVLNWTRAARYQGVTYHGKRGYLLPKGRRTNRALTFSEKKDIGIICHKRSQTSKDLRKLRKYVRSFRLTTPPLVYSRYPSAKSIRKDWYNSRGTGRKTFQQVKLEKQRSIISIWCCNFPTPEIVISALTKIYSHSVYSPVNIKIPEGSVSIPCIENHVVDFSATSSSPVVPRMRCGKVTLQERSSPGSDRIMRSTLVNFGVNDKPTIKGRIGNALAGIGWF